MKKSKIVLVLSGLFCLLFAIYLRNLDFEIANLQKNMLASPNVSDITGKFSTKVLVGAENAVGQDWMGPGFNEASWKEIQIPKYWIAQEKDFKPGNFVYYRIHIPQSLIKDFSHLKNEVSLSLYYILFKKVDIFVNGQFVKSNSPKNYDESLIITSLDETKDNLIAIRGTITTGDTGINHRLPIMVGKSAELNQLYTSSYKGQTVFTLIYILCKGSILFIFALIFFVVRVDRFFEKFLMFGIFVVSEDVLKGDFLTGILNLDQQVYLYNLVNIGIVLFLYLFMSDVVSKVVSKKKVIVAISILTVVCYGIAFDVLKKNYFFNIDQFLKFWNLMTMLVLIYFIPVTFKIDKILASLLTVALLLTGWSTFVAENVGHNLKAVGSLLIFFMAAYQTFLLFKREQDLLQINQRQLLEQEKDVAIGQTAAVLAHDVRRPLEQMHLLLNRISSGDYSEEFIKTAKRDIDFSITSVNNQINDIMNFSRTKEITLEPINFYQVLAGSVKQVMTVTNNVKIKLSYQFEATHLIQGDESRLASLLTNLLSNAVEAIRDIGHKDQGQIRFDTSMDGKYFVFNIFNDGPEIPSHMLQDIFKPLFTHGKNKGTGLGLASVAKTMKDHGGSIEVENLKGGVSFTLKFLAATAKLDLVEMGEFKPNSAEYNYQIIKAQAPDNLKPFRLFLLDDDHQVYEYFSFLISQCDFDVELTFVQNLEDAQKSISSKRYDLYILDYDLGSGKTGLDFYRENLSFLGHEVVIHSSREQGIVMNANCAYEQKPMPLENLQQLMSKTYAERLKVLLVDDSKLTQMAWEMFQGSHNLVTMSSPEEALEIIQQQHFDLYVLDFYFDNSQMNGSDLGRKIREIKPEANIVIASGAELQNSEFKTMDKMLFEVRGLHKAF
jgi:signal transduction histidine kinase/CheY-like chemotaxis protein